MANASMPTVNDVNDEFIRAITPVSVLVGILAAIAFVGNASVLIVHVFKYQSSNFRFFVLGLCAVDLISSVTILPLEIFTQLNWYVFPSSWLCKLKAFLHVFLSVSAVYVLLLIAIDRYRKICAPYGWQMKPRSLLIGYGVSFIAVTLQSSSVVVIWGLQQQVKLFQGKNVTVLVCNKDPEYVDTIWPKIFPVIMMPSFLAMGVMLILYCLVGRQIFQVVLKMRQHSKRKVQLQTISEAALKADTVKVRENKVVTSSSESESALSEPIRGEIKSILCGNADIEAIEYKVNDGSIICRNRSLKENSSVIRTTSKLSFKEKRKLEERSSQILRQTNSMVLDDSIVLDDSDKSSDVGKSVASDKKADTETSKACMDETAVPDNKQKPKLCWKETLRPKLQPLRGIKSLSKRVAFSVKPRDKLKRRTLITFVFTAIFIVTTITYMVISGHVVNGHAHSNDDMVVVLFFYRLYFINNAIHPIIYGLLDPKFRKIIKCSKKSLFDA